MSVFRSKGLDVAIPLKPLLQRMFVAALVALSVMLLFVGRSHNGLSTTIRMTLMDMVVPVVDALSAPVETANNLVAAADEVMVVYRENQRLKEENMRLLQWQQAARALEVENQSLRELMHYHPQHAISYVTARVVGKMGGPFTHQVVISAGSDQGIQPYQAVVNERGLVGRIVNVGRNTSEVLLLTDMNSRLPVMTQESGFKTILAGDRSDLPYLRFAYEKQAPALGESVVTTGDGSVFPPGLLVGKVFAESDGHWRVRPRVDFSTLHYVRVVDFAKPTTAPKHP